MQKPPVLFHASVDVNITESTRNNIGNILNCMDQLGEAYCGNWNDHLGDEDYHFNCLSDVLRGIMSEEEFRESCGLCRIGHMHWDDACGENCNSE